MVIDAKECTHCKEVKPSSEFHKRSRNKSGLRSWCCKCERVRRLERVDQERLSVVRYREAHREEYRAYHREYSRKYNENHVDQNREYNRRWRESNPDKYRARVAFAMAINNKSIKRVDVCSVCGSNYFVDAHHEDYSKPLEVQWLCRLCHRKADRARRDRLVDVSTRT